MRSSSLRIACVGLGVLLLFAVTASAADRYLIIKKKDGTTQRVPLQFSPEEIESFDVQTETGPGVGAEGEQREFDRGPAPAGQQPSEVFGREGEPPAMDPDAPEAGPSPDRPPSDARSPFGPGPEEQRPAEEQPMILREEGPQPPPEGPQAPGERKPGVPTLEQARRGPTAGVDAGIGTFTVNVYDLPENIKALPDFSAFRPTKVVTADSIDVNPAEGRNLPPGITPREKGLGMRFVGMFRVAGEGIFRWRLLAKDGVRMHIDDKTLIENDGIHPPESKTGYVHLAEGVHSLIVDNFNSSGEPVLQLFVTPPLGSEHIFSTGAGLEGWKEPAKPYDVLWGQVYFVPKGKYPKGPKFEEISPIGRIIAPELSISGGEGIPGLPGRTDMTAIRYEGFFNVEGAGIFAFRLVSDYYGKLTIGKHEIADVSARKKGETDEGIGWAFLQKGSYPIQVDYFHPAGEPVLKLFVTEPTKEEEVFAPARPLVGYDSESGNLSLIPAFVYFLKEGTNKIPNFNKLTPAGMFFTGAIDYPVDRGSTIFPGVPKREDWLGLRFYVKFALNEQEAGTYKFRVVADDGARLILGKKLVVNAQGKGVREESGSVTLPEGSHEMFLDYFQRTGKNGVQLFITPPDGEEKIFAFQ